MAELIIEKIKNLDRPDIQELLNKFKNNRNEMNIVDIAEIISKLITTLGVDHDSGRPKTYTISGEHLGKILGIGKGVVSQYMSVWNMPEETKQFLKNYNLSLINAYHASRIKEKDIKETIALQKKLIQENNVVSTSSGSGRKIDILSHSINEAQMVLNGIVTSYKIPQEILQTIPKQTLITKDFLLQKAKMCLFNLDECINYLSPKIKKLPYLKKKVEFCNLMVENGEFKFCGLDLTLDCLKNQAKIIMDEIIIIETEQKLPHISSLIMMRENLNKISN